MSEEQRIDSKTSSMIYPYEKVRTYSMDPAIAGLRQDATPFMKDGKTALSKHVHDGFGLHHWRQHS